MESTKSQAAVERPRTVRARGAGGHRLALAFNTVSSLPALADACGRLENIAASPAASRADLVDIVEGDTALTIAVMRAANNGNGHPHSTGGVPAAIDLLGTERLTALAAHLDTYDLLGQGGTSSETLDLFRRHGTAVRRAAEQVAEMAQMEERDELAVAALLHDVGKLVLGDLYGPEYGIGPGYQEAPDARVKRERRALGIDHALVGAVLIRRWDLPSAIANAVERHHAPNAKGLAAALRLADQVVHRAAGGPIPVDSLRRTAEALGLDDDALRDLLFDVPRAGVARRRTSDPCPLSAREIDALRGLAAGMVYKQIATELSLSVSTVRTHLHNVYRKIGAVDRAQAVLIARDRGWI